MNDTKNWRQLPPGDDLDRLIAERLGYTKLQVSGATGLLWGWRKARPDDPPHHIENGMVNEPISWFSREISGALSLWFEIPDAFTPRLVRMFAPRDGKPDYCFKGCILRNCSLDQWEWESFSAAEAVAKSFLVWTERDVRDD